MLNLQLHNNIMLIFLLVNFTGAVNAKNLLESMDTADLDRNFIYGTFPEDFIWATASAAYQIEGAWESEGKGPSIWDTLCHKLPNKIKDQESGDVACDSYHLWAKDIQLLKSLGTKYYRMSISWPRILPSGLADNVNPAGVEFYSNFFKNLIANGIQPMVTLYHWDLPQKLQDEGGWLNEKSSLWFLSYAQLVFKLFGSKVKYWITFNEPLVFIGNGYGLGTFAPKIGKCPGSCPYIAAHNVIKAHTMVWHAYDKDFRPYQKGKISITLNSNWCEPVSDKVEDLAAAERCMEFGLGWFANPIYGDGDYPAVMKQLVASRSTAQGLNASRMPSFTAEEIKNNIGTFDFFGLNHYTTVLTQYPIDTEILRQDFGLDKETAEFNSPKWPRGASSWLFFVPEGMRKILMWINKKYNNPPVIITENGWSDTTGALEDVGRIRYYKYYINNVLAAYQDGCNIIGYTAWSIMDNFEWLEGYTEKFGLHYVNFSDPHRPRLAKKSAAYYATVVANNGFPRPSLTDDSIEKAICTEFFVILIFLCVCSLILISVRKPFALCNMNCRIILCNVFNIPV